MLGSKIVHPAFGFAVPEMAKDSQIANTGPIIPFSDFSAWVSRQVDLF